jgi:anthranilate/para-aminobenzoate synthase component I
MAVDLHRNDLGRVAQFGSVRVLGEARTIASRTVLSRVHEIVATRRVDVDLSRIATAALPCGSVTGAPKVRAMEIIGELEEHRRGLYTGAVGYVGRDAGLVLAMAIRTGVVSKHDGTFEYFAGGGIVAGSDPKREVEETNWKAEQVSRVQNERR